MRVPGTWFTCCKLGQKAEFGCSRPIWGHSAVIGSAQLSIHLVGSVPLADAEQVFRTVCASVGPYLRRIPDGETGARRRWVGMLSEILDRHPSFEVDPDEPPFVMKLASGRVHRQLKRLRIRPGVNPENHSL